MLLAAWTMVRIASSIWADGAVEVVSAGAGRPAGKSALTRIGQVAVGQAVQARGDMLHDEGLLAGGGLGGFLVAAAFGLGLGAGALLSGLGGAQGQGVVLEHLDRAGHGADLVLALGADHLDVHRALGQDFHGARQVGQRAEIFERPIHRAKTRAAAEAIRPKAIDIIVPVDAALSALATMALVSSLWVLV